MDEDTKLPVRQSVEAGWAFLKANARRFAPAAALSALATALFLQAQFAGAPGLMVLAGLIALAMTIVYWAAVYRMAMRGEFEGPLGLQLSSDEGRLAGVGLLQFAFTMLVRLVALTPVVLVVLGVAGATGDLEVMEAAMERGEMSMDLLGPAARNTWLAGEIFVTLLEVFITVRLCLAVPATVAERRIVFLKSWPWTGDSFGRLLAAIFLTVLPGAALTVIFMTLAAQAQAAGAAPVSFLLSFAGGLAWALVGGLMSAGLFAFLYRGLRPAPE